MRRMEDPENCAEELLETWINGNRKDVMRALGNMSSMRAACVASRIVWKMTAEDGGKFDMAYDFIRMMERRLG